MKTYNVRPTTDTEATIAKLKKQSRMLRKKLRTQRAKSATSDNGNGEVQRKGKRKSAQPESLFLPFVREVVEKRIDAALRQIATT